MTQQALDLGGSGNRFADLAPEDLAEREISALIALALRALAARHPRGAAMTSPEATRDYLRLRFAERPNEVFVCLYLDQRHRLITVVELFHGTIDGASVHPREVVRRGLETRSGAVIFAHNHPSGVAELSQSDLRITQRLKDALGLVDIRLLDHLIVATEGYASLAERGLI
jgi:DNA repair protein RadC